MTFDDQSVLLLALASFLVGVGLTIVAFQSRDIPWALRIIYRRSRGRPPGRGEDVPPSVRPYFRAVRADTHRRKRLWRC